MKKAWNIDRNNLILRIIVTYLGTRGTASVLINVTDKYAGLGLIVVMSALFSVLYTILFSYYGKHSRIIKICGSVGVIALYSVVNLSNITDGFENIVNLFMQSMSSDPEYEYSVVGNGGIAAAVILVTMIMAVLAAWEVNIRPNMLFALIIILPLPGIFIAAALVPDLISVIACVSKLESGEYQVNARMFNIWETLTGVALAAEQRINDGMIELEGLTMDEKVLVYADPDLIHQVAYNLLDNAIKFTPAGGTIRFSVEKLGPEAEISIWNSGQGISPEALPYVFERFYKEDRSRGLHARGSGLGLNICKVLVNLAGGQIRVESQQGEWCRFVFTLPTCSPNPGGMKRLPDAAGQPGAVEDPASMKPVE